MVANAANTAPVGIIDEARKLLADGKSYSIETLNVDGVESPIDDVKGRLGYKVVKVTRYGRFGSADSRYRVVFPESSSRLIDETRDGVRRVLTTSIRVVFDRFPETPGEASVIVIVSSTGIDYASAPGADVCVYCGFNNMKHGSSLRSGFDCGHCGGN